MDRPLEDSNRYRPEVNGQFATTSWSLVVQATQDSSPEQRSALESLCESYWYPLYAFLRKRESRTQAEDITQAFFCDLLEHGRLIKADRDRGRFRTFLMSALQHFRSNWLRDQKAQKRGGRVAILSLDFERAERRYALEPFDEMTAERLYERSWAMTLLDRAIGRLREQYCLSGKENLFERLKHVLNDQTALSYTDMAKELDMSEGTVRVAAHRLRKRCRDYLREEIAQTVSAPEEIDAELRDLFRAFER